MRKRNFRKFLENNKWLKKVPNLLTICNSLCGFGAILYTLRMYESPRTPEEVMAISAWIVLFAMVFDALDGFAARIFNAGSLKGLQMDSLSDMVTFGVAPAVMVAVMAHSMTEMKPYQYVVVWAFCALYIGCAASRLATYNIHAMLEKKSGDKFSGLPVPGAASAVCSLIIFYSMRNGEIEQILKILPMYTAVLGLLMISNIPYPHMARWLLSLRRNKKRLIFTVAVLIMASFRLELTTVIVINAYILSGPLVSFGVRLGILPPPPDVEKVKQADEIHKTTGTGNI